MGDYCISDKTGSELSRSGKNEYYTSSGVIPKLLDLVSVNNKCGIARNVLSGVFLVIGRIVTFVWRSKYFSALFS